MGNGLAKLTNCFSGEVAPTRRRHVAAEVTLEPYDDELGHSFCYVRPDLLPTATAAASKVHHSSEETTTFRSISGASVSANTSTPLSTSLLPDLQACTTSASFESSTSFASIPLQPIPRFSSGPLAADRGFLSGPIERGFMSGPLDHRADLFSGPLDSLPSSSSSSSGRLRRTLSHVPRSRRAAASLLRGLTKAISRTISGHAALVAPIKGSKASDSADGSSGGDRTSVECGDDSSDPFDPLNGNLQWAQGKAGEDRVHVVVSEEYGWVFVGIYDGFNGPDATDYLLSNLYSAVHRDLKGLLWDDDIFNAHDPSDDSATATTTATATATTIQESDSTFSTTVDGFREEGRQRSNKRRKFKGAAEKWEEKQRRWKYQWDRERLELDRRLKEQLNSRSSSAGAVNHPEVLKALSEALRKTEAAYLGTADRMVSENPELALMGSCVLVMLMQGEDVYLMNVGDSRAVLARKADPDLWSSIGKARHDLERINEENSNECVDGGYRVDDSPSLDAVQLTLDHSTCVEEEISRIRNEHPDDASAIANDRVKGSLKVTRAFGAGFLKQPKWNNALLEMFRIDYVGTSPYITCSPSLYHHKLGPRDRFLILSSDGLYQYFTNEEAVAQVELFITVTPEGDPAQHLVEELIFRAANKAGMDFHELLEIPQGDRRRYHDDVSIIVISLEGRIWRSCV